MDCAIRPDDFWGYSLGEVRDLMESHARMEKIKAKNEIAARYELADLIGLYIQLPYDDKKTIQIPRAWDAYPGLFADEKREFEERREAEALERARASRREYAKRHNRMRRNGLG